ncbi:hypothetical protein BY996DRAFT_6411167 [Phakopsora pachyrhizi]|uniref:Uncharacterized protein n=1 Tax=Phakopsora pachyrhizi TaxID=170000 RepID=A0AAV0B6W6_PHAPC|nr:hypothetical protein BY996DRAFT_6411167 [Phakopsora pachyrhizi]CAH7672272.1 hypothetical protein PPACK8108_LOCUS7080 [Phakopsora pachyrhizi]CAH7682030.1 hypothetical protein PPACK8108_LOCUS14725 [Phakopsora pachyrhizi]
MGNNSSKGSKSSSKSDSRKEIEMRLEGEGEQVYFNPTSPVQLQKNLVDQLSEVSDGPPNLNRQTSLDSSIQKRIRSDLENLKRLEEELDEKLQKTFKGQGKQQDKDSNSVDGERFDSNELMKDLKSLREKIDQHRLRRSKDDTTLADIKSSRSKIIQCLSENRDRPLNCVEEVNQFKRVVKRFEYDYISSIQ